MDEETDSISNLKKDLQRAVDAFFVVDDDHQDSAADTACDLDAAIRTLRALKDLKLKHSDTQSVRLGNLQFQEPPPPPPEFICPLAGIPMTDPVVIASGETYEERCIRQWLEDGHVSCPRTNQVLSHTTLIPNHSVKKMIMNWCKQYSVDMPGTSQSDTDELPENVNKEYVSHMLDNLPSPSVFNQRKITKELRFLTFRLPSCRALLGEIPGAFPKFLSPELLNNVQSDEDLLEHVLATLLNVSIDETNRNKIVTECPQAVCLLVKSLRGRSIEITRLAAAAVVLYSSTTVNKHKQFLCDSGAIVYLINLIEEGDLLATNDAALALHDLCTVIQIRERAISEGAVTTIVNKIKARILLSVMLNLLTRLSSHRETVETLESLGMVQCLFDLMEDSTTSEQNKEHCIATIHAMCSNDLEKTLEEIDQLENAYRVLKQVASKGTSRAQRKATDILKGLKRAIFSHRLFQGV